MRIAAPHRNCISRDDAFDSTHHGQIAFYAGFDAPFLTNNDHSLGSPTTNLIPTTNGIFSHQQPRASYVMYGRCRQDRKVRAKGSHLSRSTTRSNTGNNNAQRQDINWSKRISLLGPSLTKSGQNGVDQQKVSSLAVCLLLWLISLGLGNHIQCFKRI